MNLAPTRSLLLRLPALLLILCPYFVSASDSLPKETWLGLYFNGKKIGWTSIRTEAATFRGKPAVKTVSTSKTQIEMLGNKVSQDIVSESYSDQSFAPIYQKYDIASNGSALKLTADYKPGKIVCTTASGAGASTRVVTVPPGVKLIADSSTPTQGQKLDIGRKSTFYYLNPLTLALEKTDVELKARENVTIADKTYAALRVVATTPFGPLTSWETPAGDILKGDLPLGMAMYGETKAAALDMQAAMPKFAVAGAAAGTKGAYKPPDDFAIATAITVDRPIERPRDVKSLSVEVSGVEDRSLILSDFRQKAQSDSAGKYVVRVTAARFDEAKSARLPIANPAVKAYLRTAPYLEADDPQIKEAALALRGRETNAYKVAVAIQRWVHDHMSPDYTIGVPRSCSEVFHRRRGVCRDYATLFAGIARAAGIPTRVVGGIVYADGRFFYHAWAECWVGSWVPFDPTLKTEFVDATHIKFAQGGVTEIYNVAGIIGRIKLSVLTVQ